MLLLHIETITCTIKLLCNNQIYCSITNDIRIHVILYNNFFYLFVATVKITLNIY